MREDGVKASIGVLVYNTVSDDPRVRRQGEAFVAAGWEVKAFGLPGGRSPTAPWMIDVEGQSGAEDKPPSYNLAIGRGRQSIRLGVFVRTLQRILFYPRNINRRSSKIFYLAVILFRLKQLLAHLEFLLFKGSGDRLSRQLFPYISKMYAAAREFEPDVWLANDWHVLPLAMQLVRENGGILVYDTHEFALNEYSQRFLWRHLRRPVVERIEGAGIRNAAVVTTVSNGIADALKEIYQLDATPIVVRNTPFYESFSRRETGAIVRILYHGIVAPGRGLEACIESVAAWREEFQLTIRGPATTAYRKELERLISDCGLQGRVFLVPPVKMTELVREAAVFDVGLFALPDHSLHNKFALPNKLFEYIMAGLMVCVSNLPEMSAIVTRHGVGRTFDGVDPEKIAECINSIDRATLLSCQKKSQAASSLLCWEGEVKRLIDTYQAAVNEVSQR